MNVLHNAETTSVNIPLQAHIQEEYTYHGEDILKNNYFQSDLEI